MNRFFSFLSLSLLFLQLSLAPVLSHGAYATVEQTTDTYITTLSYDATEIQLGLATPLIFTLAHKNDLSEAEFSKVQVEISKDNITFFSGEAVPSDGNEATLKYLFPEHGSYSISARYEDDQGDTLAAVTFPLEVALEDTQTTTGAKTESSQSSPDDAGPLVVAIIVSGIAGLAFGFLGANIPRKPKK